jgi:hypothetical protein
VQRGLAVVGGAVVALLVLAGLFVGGSALAEVRYSAAYLSAGVAVDSQADASSAEAARLRSLESVTARLGSVGAAPEFAVDTTSEAASLKTTMDEVRAFLAAPVGGTTASEAGESEGASEGESEGGGSSAPIPVSERGFDRPDGEWLAHPLWERFADVAALDSLSRAARAATDELDEATVAGAALEDRVDEAEDAYFESLATAAEGDIGANTLATKASQVSLTRLIERARDQSDASAHDGAFVSEFAAGRQALAASQAAEQAELDDPAFAVRAEIEAYARSISNGVALDFVWAPEVSGLGDGWLSGTAEVYDSDGGWALITLNYGVEDAWYDGPDSRALVTHEVGHAQVYRDSCRPLFSGAAFGQDHEMWATAWSIGQGFDVPGSGIEAYGRPSDEQIEVAAGCR